MVVSLNEEKNGDVEQRDVESQNGRHGALVMA